MSEKERPSTSEFIIFYRLVEAARRVIRTNFGMASGIGSEEAQARLNLERSLQEFDKEVHRGL